MTTTNTSATEVSFRVRPLGFDRAEVQAFIGNLLNDYAQVTRTLERLRQEMSSLRDAPERRSQPESTAKEVESILAGAARIAEEVRTRAEEESLATLRDVEARAADTLKEAETRAAAIVDSALQKAAQLDRQTESVRFQLTQMRNAIKSAAEAASMALGEISAIDDARSPAPAPGHEPVSSRNTTWPPIGCSRRAGRLVLGACLIAIAPPGLARSADTSTRIMLLPAGERASVVVEFDDEVPKATAIEAADNQSFDVEIGPVRSKVANQWLQAAKQSPLVSEVRVRVVPQGAQGMLVTLHVTAKTPVSGLVRRAQRRIYIDLEPLSVAAASKPVGRTALAAPDAAAPSAATRPPASVNPAPEMSGARPPHRWSHRRSPAAGTTSDVSPARSPATAMPTAPLRQAVQHRGLRRSSAARSCWRVNRT